jgi:malonyl-CoA/methylmalonyl-CoA synthetase
MQEARVSFLTPRTYDYVRTQWGIWRAGGVAVPLTSAHPPSEWEYLIKDSQSSLVVVHPAYEAQMRPVSDKLGVRLLTLNEVPQSVAAPPSTDHVPVSSSRAAQIVYTSGTTGRPKGVVATHANMQAQVQALVSAWEWRAEDYTVNVLPLHHVHGIVNVLTCCLWSGACLEMLDKFDSRQLWQLFMNHATRAQQGLPAITLFMAVPTVYTKLIHEYDLMSPEMQREASASLKRLRLMVSGSAALPEPVFNRWEQISGHRLLERYGMTEIGMALSNPLHGPRIPGRVGYPLPGVQVKIQPDDSTRPHTGELLVRGPQVFREYFNRPDATREAFDGEGWFLTGDIVEQSLADDATRGSYKIVGRKSVDIIKSGGYKLSALDIEDQLLTHPHIAECAVVGLADPEFGQRVAALIALRAGASLSSEQLQQWCKTTMPAYRMPRTVQFIEAIPRNAMGKVNKKELVKLFAQ